MKNTLEQVGEQIKRFQSFKSRTGTCKMSSYGVELYFSAMEDRVIVEFGGYDVGSWSRNERIVTTWDNLVDDLTAKVDEADKITMFDRWCPKCKDYTTFDEEAGVCKGVWNDGCDVTLKDLES